MRIQITEPGWAKFDGDLGTVPFRDGVSVGHVPEREAYALGAYIAVVEIDQDGNHLGPVSPGMDTIRAGDMSAEVEAPMVTLKMVQDEAKEAALRAADMDEEFEAPLVPKVWTQEELEAIASEKGIAGIREISDPLGVKGTSVRGLINEILVRNPKAE